MEKQIYRPNDLQEILGQNYQYCYRLVKKLQKELYRENPSYKIINTSIPKWYFDKCILGIKEREN